jgi:hypothetical protein
MRYAAAILLFALVPPPLTAGPRWWERIVAPFRPRVYDVRARRLFAPSPPAAPGPTATLVRFGHGNGRLDHQWIELDTSQGPVNIGFGPATFRFIDAGQVTIRDRNGNRLWISGLSVIPLLTFPQAPNDYAGRPGEGFPVKPPIRLPLSRADRLVRDLRSSHAIVPYIPFLYDCHTFACRLEAKARGTSTLPCYLPFRNP